MDKESFLKKHRNSVFSRILVMTAVLILPVMLPASAEELKIEPYEDGIEIIASASNPGCELSNSCFSPSEVTVEIGQEIIWTNNDFAAHTVTSGTVDDGPDGTFDSGLILAGESFSHTFDNVGEYNYFCSIHPWMTGTVIIQ